jgi:sec-independent protein translocase protein TatC
MRVRAIQHDEHVTVVDHLEELRWRLVWSIATLVGTFAAAWYFQDTLFRIMGRPLGGNFRVITLGVTEPFFVTMTVAGYTALAVSLPVLGWHAWRYVAPAFEPHQRRAVRPYLLLAPALFGAGVAFCYFFVLGAAVRVLLGMGAEHFDVTVRAQEYYPFVATTLLSMGLVFLFPLGVLALARIGIVDSPKLRRSRRYAVIVIAILAALLPTADPVSLLIEMAPMLALYELSIVLVRLQERRLRRAAEAAA